MQEKRIISFRDMEVMDALAAFRDKSDYEPVGFHDIRVTEQNGEAVVECLDRDSDQTHRYSDHELCTALMLYCIDNKVPLPRRGSKSVYVSDDGIRLIVELGRP